MILEEQFLLPKLRGPHCRAPPAPQPWHRVTDPLSPKHQHPLREPREHQSRACSTALASVLWPRHSLPTRFSTQSLEPWQGPRSNGRALSQLPVICLKLLNFRAGTAEHPECHCTYWLYKPYRVQPKAHMHFWLHQKIIIISKWLQDNPPAQLYLPPLIS